MYRALEADCQAELSKLRAAQHDASTGAPPPPSKATNAGTGAGMGAVSGDGHAEAEASMHGGGGGGGAGGGGGGAGGEGGSAAPCRAPSSMPGGCDPIALLISGVGGSLIGWMLRGRVSGGARRPAALPTSMNHVGSRGGGAGAGGSHGAAEEVGGWMPMPTSRDLKLS